MRHVSFIKLIFPMKKWIFLLFTCYLIDVKGQNNFEWADSAAVWHLTSGSFLGPGYQKMVYEKDTIINNQECQKISRYSQIKIQTGPGTFTLSPIMFDASYFLYKSNDSVFSYHDNHFFLAFKTNAFVGEIWDLGKLSVTDTIQHAYVKVDSVYFETYNGQSLRNIKIHACDINGDSINYTGPNPDTALTAFIAPGYMGSVVNEKFGPFSGFNGINQAASNFGVIEYMPAQLNCYQSASFPLLQFQNSDCFNNIFTGLYTENIQRMPVSPNPMQTQVFFDEAFIGDFIVMYDIHGKIIMQNRIVNNEINISMLNRGLYFYSISNQLGEVKHSGKLIKN